MPVAVVAAVVVVLLVVEVGLEVRYTREMGYWGYGGGTLWVGIAAAAAGDVVVGDVAEGLDVGDRGMTCCLVERPH